MGLMGFIGKQFVKNKGIMVLPAIFMISITVPIMLFSGLTLWKQIQPNSDIDSNKLTAYNIAWNKYSELISTNYKELNNEERHLSDDDELDISVNIVGDVLKDDSVIAKIDVYDRKTNSVIFRLSEPISGQGTTYDTTLDTNGTFKTPNGLIYKWGIVDNVSFYGTNKYSIKFDTPFPNKCLNVIQDPVIQTINYGYYNTSADVYSYDKNGIVFIISTFGFAPTGKIMWRAIGY